MDRSEPTRRVENDTGSTTSGSSRGKRPARPEAAGLERGTSVGRYTILEHLGSGGMASVYSAYDTQLERIVALKMLRADLESDDVRARMVREAQAMARLKHQHVVTVYEVGTFEDRIFIAMEFVDGTTLSKWADEPRSWRELLEVLKAAGRGLAAAHDAGLVHRDFKPDNVLVGRDGRIVVSDFGIALSQQGTDAVAQDPVSGAVVLAPAGRQLHAQDDGALASDTGGRDADTGGPKSASTHATSSRSATDRLTEEGAVLGTLGYIAPEHLLEGFDDARSDQFSFCVTMYRLLYGTRPFEFRNLPTYCVAIQKPPRTPPHSTHVPGWVHAIILRGLQVEPARRFASMHDLLAELERDPWKRRRRWALGACLVASAIAASGGYAQHRAELRAKSREGAAWMASTWNPAVEQKLRASLENADPKRGGDLARTVVGKLNEYARNWTAAHRAISEATLIRGEQNVATMDRQLRCLERGRDQFTALTDVLSKGGAAAAQHAIDAVYALDRPSTCETSDVAAIPVLPAVPELRARALAVEHTIAQAVAFENAGSAVEAEHLVDQALPETRSIPYPRAEAELLLIAAESKETQDDIRNSLELHQAAFRAALRAADESLAARAAAKSAHLFAHWLDQPQEAERWMLTAEALSERASTNRSLQAEVLTRRIVVNAMTGHADKNLDLHERHIDLIKSLYDEDDPRVADALRSQGLTYGQLNEWEQAIPPTKRALELQIRVFGATHPVLGLTYSNLAANLMGLSRFDEAKVLLQRGIETQSGMPAGALSVNLYANMGKVDFTLGNDRDAAIESFDQALRLVRELGQHGVHEWFVRLARAEVIGRKGDLRGQAQECASVLAQAVAADPTPDTLFYRAEALQCIGRAELTLHELGPALAHLEESVSLYPKTNEGSIKEAQSALARALAAAHRDGQRACQLAESARPEMQKYAVSKREVEELDALLATQCSSARR